MPCLWCAIQVYGPDDTAGIDSTEGDCEAGHLCAGKMVTGGGKRKRGLGAAGFVANTDEQFSKQ